jgi:hypothetical protein
LLRHVCGALLNGLLVLHRNAHKFIARISGAVQACAGRIRRAMPALIPVSSCRYQSSGDDQFFLMLGFN